MISSNTFPALDQLDNNQINIKKFMSIRLFGTSGSQESLAVK